MSAPLKKALLAQKYRTDWDQYLSLKLPAWKEKLSQEDREVILDSILAVIRAVHRLKDRNRW
ncbi:MAG: hypothetical protein HPY50_20195 [Firmicutes bacterium]|nr:hypothetical protein [Bacillota bacterium]